MPDSDDENYILPLTASLALGAFVIFSAKKLKLKQNSDKKNYAKLIQYNKQQKKIENAVKYTNVQVNKLFENPILNDTFYPFVLNEFSENLSGTNIDAYDVVEDTTGFTSIDDINDMLNVNYRDIDQSKKIIVNNNMDIIDDKYQPHGLRNLGNTCYMNSVSQCLLCLKGFSSSCKNLDDNNLWIQFKKSNENPVTLHNEIIKLKRMFKNMTQHDSHEVLITILDGIDENISNLFHQHVSTTIKCLKCKLRSFTKNKKYRDITLECSNSLEESINNFQNDEEVMWYCPRCKKNNISQKKLKINFVGNHIIFHVNRFTHNKRKNNTLLQIPDKYKNYQLSSFVVHLGQSINSGHYISYCKDYEGTWYCTSDNSINIVNEKDALQNAGKAYILFYSK